MPVSRHLVLATVTGFPDTHVAYPYCLCCYSKLLKDQNQDCWLCCKCGQSCRSDQVEWRYRLALTITDGDTIASVCLFGSMLDQFFGCTATQFKRYFLRLESSCDHSDELLKRAVEQSFIGHSYYFGFKTTGTINRQGPNAPITLRQLVSNLETKCQTSHESVSNIVAFQILPSTTTTQSTVLDLVCLDLRKKSSVLTERSPSEEVEAHLTTDQTFSPVRIHGATNEPSVSFCDANRSAEGYKDLTHSPSFVSVCGSSFGQETALLSCDMSKSVNNISCEVLSQLHSTNTCDQTATKGNPNEKDSLGQFSTEQQSSDDVISSEKYAPDFSCMDKSSAYSSLLGIQESSASHELMKSRSQRLDSSGYNSLLKSLLSLDGNSKEFSGIDGSINQGSWNKENVSNYKLGVESVKENDPFSGSLNNSAILLACFDCTAKSSSKPMFNSDNVEKSSAKSEHPSSKGKHVLVTRASRDNVSCVTNVHIGCNQENSNTGDRIKDRFKQFASVRNNRNRKKSNDKNHILANTESTSDQLLMSGRVGTPVGNTSKVFMSDGDRNTMKEGKVPLLTSDTKMKNQNHALAFPESEDMWAYLTDEEEFCNAGNISVGRPHTVQSKGGNNVTENVNISQVYKRTPNTVQSKGGNHVTENVNISKVYERTPNTVQSKGGNHVTENVNNSQDYKSRKTGSDEEDSDETFDECFDPEFLNLVEQDFTDAEDNSDEMACNGNKKNDSVMQDFYDKIKTAGKLDSDDDVDTGSQDSDETHISDEDDDAGSHNADEENDEGSLDSDEVFDTGTHESDEDVDTGIHVSNETHVSNEDVDTGIHDSDEDVDTGTHDSDETHNSDKDVDTGIHDSDEDVDTGTHDSDEDVDTVTQYSDKETDMVGKCNADDNMDVSGTQDFDDNLHTAGMHGSDKRSKTADKFDIDDEGTNREIYTREEIDFTKSRAVLSTSQKACTSTTALSVSEKHPTDHNTKLDNPESDAYLQGGVEPMPDSEDLCAFLDSTFGDVTEEPSLKILSHVLYNNEDVAGENADDHLAENDEENGVKLGIKDNKNINNENKLSTSASENSDLGNLNSESELENVSMKTNFKDETQRNSACIHVLPTSDETIEHLESMFDDSFDEVEIRNEDQVHSSQETVFSKCPTHEHHSFSTRDKTAQSSSKSFQHHSERENCHPLQDKVNSLCSSANTVSFVSRLPDPYNRDIDHSRDDSTHYQRCEDLQNQDPYSQDLPIQDNLTEDKQSQDVLSQLQRSQDITGQNLLHNDDQHHLSENCLSQDQSCLSKESSLNFNTSTDLFGCSGNSSVALCNDTYSQSLTHDGVHFFPNSSRVEEFRTAICSPLRNGKLEIEEKVKTVQFARRLSCVKTIQLIDIEMKMRQNPGLKLPAIPKSCLKVQVASPCSPPCFKRDTKKLKLSKVFNLRKQEKLESQDLFSCSTISENSCDVIINPRAIFPGGTEDVFSCDDAAIPGTQDLFTPSPVQMSDSINSDFVLGSASCNRKGKRFKFPTWTKKPSHCQAFVSTPLEGFTDKLCASREELSGLVSPKLSQGSEDSFAQNSASLFLDSFDDLHVTNSSSAQVVRYPFQLENHSLRTTNLGKRKDISPICIGFNSQSRGDNHIPTGEVTLDTGTPDLFGTSNVSASTSGFRSSKKFQSSNLATNFTFPVKRLFLD
ncbi:uncharacterized protein LOC110445487 [Mizuhopecten yessoensis]|nr:uncharacterized protein LOC110445487 [Mizuhopecten yessoensis]XP_021345822.1 uncharacterized protein LOC110445487 [Mizuhopecten yessoensis]XP_021345823.1 uncharacterized protein LOC110445487 [Mizuhopecten yessoensis]